MTLSQALLPTRGAGGVVSVPQRIPFQPGRATVVMALSQQERFSILPTFAGSEHPYGPMSLCTHWS